MTRRVPNLGTMEPTSSSSIDEWISLALYEYEQIASLSNIQSLLGTAVVSLPSPPTVPLHPTYDPKVLLGQMRHGNVDELLSSYSDRIDDVRKTHAQLKLPWWTNSHPGVVMDRSLTHHMELSERVIHTVMRTSSGPCGLFYENGLIRPSSANDHETTIVALAALRASISRIQREFGGASSGGETQREKGNAKVVRS